MTGVGLLLLRERVHQLTVLMYIWMGMVAVAKMEGVRDQAPRTLRCGDSSKVALAFDALQRCLLFDQREARSQVEDKDNCLHNPVGSMMTGKY